MTERRAAYAPEYRRLMVGLLDEVEGRFGEPERARSFALLALDFVKRLLEKRIERIEALDTGAEFEAPEHVVERRR